MLVRPLQLAAIRAICLFGILFCSLPKLAPCQDHSSGDSGLIHGVVLDPANDPVPGVTVTLQFADSRLEWITKTDAQGSYRFLHLRAGPYTLRTKLDGWQDSTQGPLQLAPNQTLAVDIPLKKSQVSAQADDPAASIRFSEQPTFTVSAVSDPSNLGGHGSEVAMHTTDSLAKSTASLNSPDIEEEKKQVAALLNSPDSAKIHVLLGDIAENEGRPLEAVHEYQRAAEMDPSEPNLFAWAAELLLHRAPEPAMEVFRKAHAAYPNSSRILIGFGVASYALGLFDQAAAQLAAACDIAPADPTPYLFLGKMQVAENTEPAGWTERLKRFTELHPKSSQAHFYYAVALSKNANAPQNAQLIERSLLNALELDPKFGDAYLQLGILYAGQKNFPKAIDAYEKAVQLTPDSDQPHLRLAEAYRLTGEREKARAEIEQYNRIHKEETEKDERQRRTIQQFVYTLRGPSPAPAAVVAEPHP